MAYEKDYESLLSNKLGPGPAGYDVGASSKYLFSRTKSSFAKVNLKSIKHRISLEEFLQELNKN